MSIDEEMWGQFVFIHPEVIEYDTSVTYDIPNLTYKVDQIPKKNELFKHVIPDSFINFNDDIYTDIENNININNYVKVREEYNNINYSTLPVEKTLIISAMYVIKYISSWFN
jgi:hypothetical protein